MTQPVFPYPVRRVYAFASFAAIALMLAACSAPVDSSDEHVALDLEMERLVSLDGQRRLSSFMLPDDGDWGAIPQDPRNPIIHAKVVLGRLLFHETALATRPLRPEGAGTYSCSTCHHADAGFQAGQQRATAEGGSGWGAGRRPNPSYPAADVDVMPLRSPSALNGAYQRVTMWSGSLGAHGPNASFTGPWEAGAPEHLNALLYDGLETQAIAGLTGHRMDNLENSILHTNSTYRALWEAAWPGQEVSLTRMGLAIAAYERTLLANKAPFQKWLRGEFNAMNLAEKRGAVVFFGEAKCADCHTGPALNQMAFYALGMPDMPGTEAALGRGGFTGMEHDTFTFKVPQLYNLADSPFLGHGGTFNSVREVVDYYDAGRPAMALPPGRVTPQFNGLDLTSRQLDDLTAFLVGALRDPDLRRYVPDSLPSGNCFPANDPEARRILGCD